MKQTVLFEVSLWTYVQGLGRVLKEHESCRASLVGYMLRLRPVPFLLQARQCLFAARLRVLSKGREKCTRLRETRDFILDIPRASRVLRVPARALAFCWPFCIWPKLQTSCSADCVHALSGYVKCVMLNGRVLKLVDERTLLDLIATITANPLIFHRCLLAFI